MSDKLDHFVELLKSIFELDKSDLDFGIYRILNIRQAETLHFLKQVLPQQVHTALLPYASNSEETRRRMAEIEQICDMAGIEVAKSKMADEYASLEKQAKKGTDISELESDVYSALYKFFNRYYDEGDFISKRRYGDDTYLIPYNGEEVKLYWANQDQYYIKTSENFKDYTFLADDYTVHFLLTDATAEADNVKETQDSKRAFMLYEEKADFPELKTFEFREATNEFIVRFVYDIPADKKTKYLEVNSAAIRQKIAADYPFLISSLLCNVSSDPKKPKFLIDRHLERYVSKNTFDYFIHKNLHEFLSRELDFYIKNDVIHLDDIDTANEKLASTYLAKARAIKAVGQVLIDFLAQIEDFQKKMWLKKKFVVSTNWCITLDRIPHSFYSEIVQNKAQVQEWISLYAIDLLDGFSEELSEEFLVRNQNLIVDTAHFPSDFTGRLMASFENLEESTDGLLVHSDNFQALNLLKERYQNSVSALYADPPYNTNASEILYKNGYKHSSWISLINDRALAAKKLLTEKAIACYTIDDLELNSLSILLDGIFGPDNKLANVLIRNNPSGRSTVKGFSINHEYALFYANSSKAQLGRLPHNDAQKNRYDLKDEHGYYEWENFRKNGTDSDRADRPRQFFPIAVENTCHTLLIPSMEWNEAENQWDIKETIPDSYTVVYPYSGGIAKVWKYGIERTREIAEELLVKETPGGFELYRKKYLNEGGSLPRTWWDKPAYSARDNGTRALTDLFGPNRRFDFPKAPEAVADCLRVSNVSRSGLVLDFFAGSGTTADTVINLNREDGGSRRYILIEMGQYFDEVTKPRVLKSIYADSWKAGRPANRDSGISHMMKYIQLESYEDALANISLSEDKHQLHSLFGDDYLIHYMLDIEAEDSILDLDQFKTPFQYKLKITENNTTREKTADLCETFQYLIGLKVQQQGAVQYFHAKPDETGPYEGAVTLVPDVGGEYAFRKISGTLPDGRTALIFWRNITEDLTASNAALDAYFLTSTDEEQRRKTDVIYINGDSNIECLRSSEEHWRAYTTESEFKRRMFEVE